MASEQPKENGGGGGVKAWLPLVITLVLMPVVAYLMTTMVLVPKLAKTLKTETAHARETEEEPQSGKETQNSGAKPKTKVQLSKIVVNVSGSLGSRLLLASLTLAGNAKDFKDKVEDSNDQLRDLASSVLAAKTISDLEKPEARTLLRAELLSQFNAVLHGAVQEIYITEFAIQ